MSDIGQDVQKTSAPGLLMNQKPCDSTSEKVYDGDKEVLIRVRTATMTSSDSSRTLVDTVKNERQISPNPAGAASAGGSGSHVRHTTCSSVESEGFHSVTSEELSLEDLIHQDWSQWSKEVKCVCQCHS